MKLDSATQNNVDVVEAGLAAMRAKQLRLEDTDVDPQFINDFQHAIDQGRVEQYIAAIPPASAKLKTIVGAMRQVREFVDSFKGEELAVS